MRKRARASPQGTLRDALGNTYEGSWRHGRRHGNGKLTSACGRYAYEGEWSDDRRNGRGKVRRRASDALAVAKRRRAQETDTSGATFSGVFVNNQRKGAGTLQFGRRRIEGEWNENRPVGQAVEVLPGQSGSDAPPPSTTFVYNESGTQTQPSEPTLSFAAPILFF